MAHCEPTMSELTVVWSAARGLNFELGGSVGGIRTRRRRWETRARDIEDIEAAKFTRIPFGNLC